MNPVGRRCHEPAGKSQQADIARRAPAARPRAKPRTSVAVAAREGIEGAVEQPEEGVHRAPSASDDLACPACAWPLNRMAHSAGLSVSDSSREMAVAVAIVIGELAIELAGDAADEGGRDEHGQQHQGDGDQRRPDLVHGDACRLATNSVRPSALRSTFSTTTIASSTTMPTASTSPNRVSMLSEKPKRLHDRARADQRHREWRPPGTRVARQVLRNSSTTSTTSARRLEDGARTSLAIETSMNSVGIVGDAILEPFGEALGHLGHRVLDIAGGAHRIGARLAGRR